MVCRLLVISVDMVYYVVSERRTRSERVCGSVVGS